MKIKTDKVRQLLNEIDQVIDHLRKAQFENQNWVETVCATYRKSARNLIHYRAFRSHDLRGVQKKLKNLGMSRLARSQGHVMASLINSKFILESLIEENSPVKMKSGLSIKNGKKLLVNHTKELLGYRSKGRRVRIMVTQPTEAAYDYEMVQDMVKSGMNCARVNCAHDGPEVWEKIISNIKKASKAQGRKVRIAMDLAGPKIRTGPIMPGAKVRKFSPERDEMGNVTNPALIILAPIISEDSEPNIISVDPDWFSKLNPGDKLRITDTRHKERTLKVIQTFEDQVWVNCYDTSYIGTGTILKPERGDLEDIIVGEMPPIEQSLLLRANDLLTIHKENKQGEPAQFDEDGNLTRQAHISCQLPEVFDKVRVGEVVLFDDGKIEGIVEGLDPGMSFEVRITRAKELGSKLKAEKGINFPTTEVGVSGLTEKDKEDLKFVAEHADVVNFSFVNCKEDVEELLEELEKLDAFNKLSVILKIETQRAFDNLVEILLTAMRMRYVGVMIARGDLAVETGWQNIGWVQKEILSMCNAAHVPVVWATQVLENLAKKGLPSRSEITDATSSLKAECVMLNKGAYINNAIQLLDKILRDMEQFDEKNEAMLPQLEKLLG